MSRRLIASTIGPIVAIVSIVATSTTAHADDEPAPVSSDTPVETDAAVTSTDDADDRGDQGIGAAIGIAAGGRTTPGGFRVEGHYTYQMSSTDWFDGTASFTFGSGGAACFRDRADRVICDHSFLDGTGIEIAAGVRRYFAAQGADGRFRPFARVAVGLAIARFGDDDLTGIAVPIHGGVGLRARVAPSIAIVAMTELMIGLGSFGRVGGEPQAGFAVTAGAEMRLK